MGTEAGAVTMFKRWIMALRRMLAGGAPTTTEAEITPAMVEAGAAAFNDFDSRFEDVEDAVCEIYRAMVAAKIKEAAPIPI